MVVYVILETVNNDIGKGDTIEHVHEAVLIWWKSNKAVRWIVLMDPDNSTYWLLCFIQKGMKLTLYYKKIKITVPVLFFFVCKIQGQPESSAPPGHEQCVGNQLIPLIYSPLDTVQCNSCADYEFYFGNIYLYLFQVQIICIKITEKTII